MFLRKLRLAASYRYISIMLRKDDLLLRKWLYLIKIDSLQEFQEIILLYTLPI